jgi:hypothetical protein
LFIYVDRFGKESHARAQPAEKPGIRLGILSLRPYLIAVSPAAKLALGGDEYRLAVLPFRVGRDTRTGENSIWIGKWKMERRKGIKKPINDLYIFEPGKEKFVSRKHFLIDELPKGVYVLIDRESSLGTLVKGTLIGGDRKGGGVHLANGTKIIIGGEKSPFVFRFELREVVDN